MGDKLDDGVLASHAVAPLGSGDVRATRNRFPAQHPPPIAMSRSFTAALLGLLTACAPSSDRKTATAPAEQAYLYLWTASADTTQPDFLAVLDVTEDSARYGRLVTTLAVPGLANYPHHTEHELPADRQLFANGFGSGQVLRLRPDQACRAADRGGVRRCRRLCPSALVPATRQRQRPGDVSDAACHRQHARWRLGGTHTSGNACAVVVGRYTGRRRWVACLQRGHRASARPHRDDVDRHGRRHSGRAVAHSADLAIVRSLAAEADHAARPERHALAPSLG